MHFQPRRKVSSLLETPALTQLSFRWLAAYAILQLTAAFSADYISMAVSNRLETFPRGWKCVSSPLETLHTVSCNWKRQALNRKHIERAARLSNSFLVGLYSFLLYVMRGRRASVTSNAEASPLRKGNRSKHSRVVQKPIQAGMQN